MKFKKLGLTLAALCGFFIAQIQPAQAATCSNYTSYSDGQILTSGSLNSLQTHYTDCINDILNGDTFTGNVVLHSGSDALLYSDTGSTLKAAVYGDSGKIIGAPVKVGTYNINLKRGQTSVAGDSITVECGGAACSATNPGFVVMNGTTAGATTQFTITSDVTLDLTGAHWGAGTTGDLTGRIIRALFVNDNGTLRTCAALLGGRDTLLTTDTNATATNINLPKEVLCNTAVSSSTNTVLEIGYVRVDFDDTGGSSEDLNTIQSGVNDVVTGKSADGLWQPWNPSSYTGFSLDPSVVAGTNLFTQYGRTMHVKLNTDSGTSDATNFQIAGLPAEARTTSASPCVDAVDNSSGVSGAEASLTSGTRTVGILLNNSSTGWTASGGKRAGFNFTYPVGPAASFID